MNIVRRCKRVLACSCSHGTHINRAAADAVLAFKEEFKPDVTMHLGDFLDTTAFMSKAGESERGQSVVDDCEAGVRFLGELKPDVVFIGNHDNRLYKVAQSPNAIVQAAAQSVISKLEACIAIIGADLVPYTGFIDSVGWRKMGPCVWGHGVVFNEQCARDHAEAFGMSCVFGHTHKAIEQPGRTMMPSIGYSIGCLCDKPSMGYAAGRRASLAWQHAFIYGEVTEGEICLNLRTLASSKPAPIPEIAL